MSATDSYARRFGEALREARERASLSQAELAEQAGIAEKYLSRIERGRSTPSVRLAVRLADSLGVPLQSLAIEKPAPHAEQLAEVARLFRHRKRDELDRAVRILRELFR